MKKNDFLWIIFIIIGIGLFALTYIDFLWPMPEPMGYNHPVGFGMSLCLLVAGLMLKVYEK